MVCCVSRKKNNLEYPVNVARMIARETATTHFILAADIELYPSYNVISDFLNMVHSNGILKKTVYVLPIFEMEENVAFPRNKSELAMLHKNKTVIVFHQFFCSSCHKVPNFETWINQTEIGKYETQNMPISFYFLRMMRWQLTLYISDKLNIFHVSKRYGIWEPIFIGTNGWFPAQNYRTCCIL